MSIIPEVNPSVLQAIYDSKNYERKLLEFLNSGVKDNPLMMSRLKDHSRRTFEELNIEPQFKEEFLSHTHNVLIEEIIEPKIRLAMGCKDADMALAFALFIGNLSFCADDTRKIWYRFDEKTCLWTERSAGEIQKICEVQFHGICRHIESLDLKAYNESTDENERDRLLNNTKKMKELQGRLKKNSIAKVIVERAGTYLLD